MCCHVALGAGFPELYPGGLEMNMEQRKEVGINDSMIHVDFMIGTRDLSIVGVDKTVNKSKSLKMVPGLSNSF